MAETSVAVTVFDLQSPVNNRLPRVVDAYVDEVWEVWPAVSFHP